MTDMLINEVLLIAVASLIGLLVVSLTALRGWQGWLALKERELEQRCRDVRGGPESCAARIELADLKERIRKLEAIASGVEY